jgi:hypothetical protein
MAINWAFKLHPVVQRILYRQHVADTQTYEDLSLAIETYRAMLPTVRPHVRAMS